MMTSISIMDSLYSICIIICHRWLTDWLMFINSIPLSGYCHCIIFRMRIQTPIGDGVIMIGGERWWGGEKTNKHLLPSPFFLY
jgi:hypothetical protein